MLKLMTFLAAALFASSAFAAGTEVTAPAAQQQTAPAQHQTAVPQHEKGGIDSLFGRKFASVGNTRDCHAVAVPVADEKYVPVAVLLPADGNEPPNGRARRVSYTFEAMIDPNTARMSPYNTVIDVKECSFGKDGQSVWFHVITNPIKNKGIEFLGTVIPLTADQVAAHVTIHTTIASGTYKGHWVQAGDHNVVVLEATGTTTFTLSE